MSCKPMTRKEWAASVDEMWKSAVEFTYKDLIDEAVKAEREALCKAMEDQYTWDLYDPASTAIQVIKAREQI